ncbi:hypothetical protein [Nocardia salmonicida]|uniref:hypothetical protein n=1 Tax=Nocardia salmonicida TaxID=53431 RepID=UPI0007A48255|nr:hypothetical protein [Nocardia salmonicida]
MLGAGIAAAWIGSCEIAALSPIADAGAGRTNRTRRVAAIAVFVTELASSFTVLAIDPADILTKRSPAPDAYSWQWD